MKYILSPSLLSLDFTKAGEQIAEAEQAGADWMHVDVMDGMFVPNISFGMPVIKSLRKATNRPFDVHLMIEQPERYISDFTAAGANRITVHVEAVKHLDRVIHQIHEAGCQAGVALNPATSLETIKYIAQEVDMILLMTVNPGFGGQVFIENTLKKVRQLRQLIAASGSRALIEVDGGVQDETAPRLVEAGVDVLVSGSYIFKSPHPEQTIHDLHILSR